jgi:hypothetical protein
VPGVAIVVAVHGRYSTLMFLESLMTAGVGVVGLNGIGGGAGVGAGRLGANVGDGALGSSLITLMLIGVPPARDIDNPVLCVLLLATVDSVKDL